MGNAVQLLNWFWWRNRIAIIVMVLFVIVAQTAFWVARNELSEPTAPWVGILLILSMMASLFCAIAVFSDGRNLEFTSGKSAFPMWLYSLPVSSSKLASVPIIGMMIALAWGWIPFAWAISRELPTISILNLVVLPWLGMCAVASWLQVASWRPFRSGWHRLVAMVLAILVVAVLIALGSVLPSWFSFAAVIAAAATGFSAAFFSVSNARYHGWRSDMSATDSQSSPNSVSTHVLLASFTKLNPGSAMSALRWRDWHRIGRIAATLMLMIALPAIILVISKTPSATTIVFILAVPTCLIASVASVFGRDAYFKGKFEMTHYLAALPVSDRWFLKARLVTMLKTSIVMWLMGLVVFAIWLLKSDNPGQLQNLVGALEQMFPSGFQSGWPMFIGCVLLSLYTAIVAPFPGFALGLCGRKKLELVVAITLSTIGFVSIMTICLYASKVLEQLTTPEARSQYMEWLVSWIPGVVLGLLIVKILVTVVSFWVAGKRVSVSWSLDGGKLVTGFVACALLVVLFCVLIPASVIPNQTIAMIVVLLFPFASLMLAYAALDWNRHR